MQKWSTTMPISFSGRWTVATRVCPQFKGRALETSKYVGLANQLPTSHLWLNLKVAFESPRSSLPMANRCNRGTSVSTSCNN
jgi:hypothetical protein